MLPAWIVPPRIVAVATDVSAVVAVELFPAITPPLPAVVEATLVLAPVAITTRAPARSGALVMPVPRLAVVATAAVDVASTPPMPTKPPAMPVASATWQVVAEAVTATSPSGSRTVLPMVAVAKPALVALQLAPIAPRRSPPAPAIANASAVLPDSPGASVASTTRLAADNGRPPPVESSFAVTTGLAVASASETPTPEATPTAMPIAREVAEGMALATIHRAPVALSELVEVALAVTSGLDTAIASAPEPLATPPARPVAETRAVVVARLPSWIERAESVPSTNASTLPLAVASAVALPIATAPPAAP